MPVFIRYPFFGCVILALSACGSSGNSRLLEPETTSPGEGETPTQSSESYPGVEYLIADLDEARAKFGATTQTPAPLPSRELNGARDNVVLYTNRYLSTGGTLIRTNEQDNVVTEAITIPDGGCSDETATDAAQCKFPMDALREATTFSFGVKNLDSLTFAADREPVMNYRDIDLSQVRTADASKAVYEDSDGNEYLLTTANVQGMNLEGVDLPSGVSVAPAFADLLAVYKDGAGNEYLLTPGNVASMNLEGVALPDGVIALPDFASLSVVMKGSDSDYVGYDGLLQYSMFFVGVDRFYDEDGTLMHLRLGHASMGRIYDEDTDEGVQMPTVSLTGEGAMVGVESRKGSLEHHLVQGDVNIRYDPSVAEDTANNVAAMDAMIDITITDIMRLEGDEPAWYAGPLYAGALTWEDVVVMDSKFSAPGTATATTPGNGKLLGSLYGTKDTPEVGGVFHHGDYVGGLYEIVGSFGSKLTPAMNPDQ